MRYHVILYIYYREAKQDYGTAESGSERTNEEHGTASHDADINERYVNEKVESKTKSRCLEDEPSCSIYRPAS